MPSRISPAYTDGPVNDWRHRASPMFHVPDLSNLQHVVHAAVRVDDAVGGMIQLLEAGEGLRLTAPCGLPPAFIERAALVATNDNTACAQAAAERRRVVVRDVLADPATSRYLELAALGGFRAVQSTPLIDRDRRLLGVLTTLFAVPHHPSTGSLKELDCCARIAARLIEAVRLHDEVVASDRRLGLSVRGLSPAAAQAADAARILLVTLGRDGSSGLMQTAERKLTVLADELACQLQREGALARA